MIRLGSSAPWEARYGYSRIVRAGTLVSVAGTTGFGPDGRIAGPGAYEQALAAIGNVAAALERLGLGLEAVVRTRMYVGDPADCHAAGLAHGEAFGAIRPASSMLVVARLIEPEIRFEIEADAYDPRAEARVGHGFDAHRLVEGRPFVLGGVTIPFERGPLGHSDGDALAHAVSDAVLGACALGEIGRHFKDSDPRWRGADSMVLLAACGTMAATAGFAIRSVDATAVVQAPRLAPFLDAMRDRIAAALDLPATAVSVKAKTSEGMGYTGDGSGIAAYAVAVVAGGGASEAKPDIGATS